MCFVLRFPVLFFLPPLVGPRRGAGQKNRRTPPVHLLYLRPTYLLYMIPTDFFLPVLFFSTSLGVSR
jgi:hypothetical protein